MLRHSVCAALAFLLVAGSLPAESKKPMVPRMTTGKIKKIDPKKGVLTLTVKKGDKEKETTIDIGDDTKFVVLGKGGAKELTAKEAAKAEAFKAGANVHVMKGPDGGVRIMAGGPLDFPHPDFAPPGNFVTGKIKEIDADKGTVTVTIKDKAGKAKDKEFKVGKDTRVMVISGEGPPKPTRGKAGLKAKPFKAGAMVSLQADKEGTLKMIMAGGPPFGMPHQPGEFFAPVNMVMGKIKDVDADKGTLTVTVKGKNGKEKDKEFKVTKDTHIMVMGGQGPPKKGKAGLKAKQIKPGTPVHIGLDKDGKVRAIMVGGPFTRPPDQPIGTPFGVGIVNKIDTDKGILTVTTKGKGASKEVDFKISDETRFMIQTGTGKPTMVTGTKGLKKLKKGMPVHVQKDPAGKVRMVMSMPMKPIKPDDEDEPEKPAKGKHTQGTIKKVDAENGTLTLTVKDEEEAKEEKCKVTDKTKFVFSSKDEKVELTGKKGLKSDRFKAGTEVTVVMNPDGTARTVTAKPKKGKLEKED